MLALVPGAPEVKPLAALRADAVKFAHEWDGVQSEISEKQTFWNEVAGRVRQERRREIYRNGA